MKKRVSAWLLASVLGMAAFPIYASPISHTDLKEFAFNVDGTFTPDYEPTPPGVDLSAFDTTTGRGIITATVTGAGGHFFGGWFDHEIDQAANTHFNEFGTTSGTPAAGQSWEIDEPGFGSPKVGSDGGPYFGDIYWNIENSTPGTVHLDNQEFYDWVDDQTLTPPDDVSMAMGWDFDLLLDEVATIVLVLDLNAPGDGFYLSHTDPDSDVSIFFSSSLTITSAIPEPSVLLLFGAGLLGLGGIYRRRPAV